MIKQISPSLMCADFLNLGGQLRRMAELGVDYLHADVMDGRFVPNYSLFPDLLRAARDAAGLPLDYHLMVEDPAEKLGWFDIRPGDIVSIHAESDRHLQRTLAEIRRRGAKAGLALNPATPTQVLDYLLPDLDVVLVMTVNPGFAGQKLIPACIRKISEVARRIAESDYPDILIEVDGNVSFEHAKTMSEAGANIFVAGTSSLFSRELSLEEAYLRLKQSIL